MREPIALFHKTAPTIGLVNDRQQRCLANTQKSRLQYAVKISGAAQISLRRRQHHRSTAPIAVPQASAQAATPPARTINPHSVRCTA